MDRQAALLADVHLSVAASPPAVPAAVAIADADIWSYPDRDIDYLSAYV